MDVCVLELGVLARIIHGHVVEFVRSLVVAACYGQNSREIALRSRRRRNRRRRWSAGWQRFIHRRKIGEHRQEHESDADVNAPVFVRQPAIVFWSAVIAMPLGLVAHDVKHRLPKIMQREGAWPRHAPDFNGRQLLAAGPAPRFVQRRRDRRSEVAPSVCKGAKRPCRARRCRDRHLSCSPP